MSDFVSKRSCFVTVGHVAPRIGVCDIARSLGCCCKVLGFDKVSENGEPAGFALLERDEAELHCIDWPVRIVKASRDADHGLRDPDGKRIDIGERLRHPSAGND